MKNEVKNAYDSIKVESVVESAETLMDNEDFDEYRYWNLASVGDKDYALVLGWSELSEPMEEDEYADMDYIIDDYAIHIKLSCKDKGSLPKNYDDWDIPFNGVENYWEYKAWFNPYLRDIVSIIGDKPLNYFIQCMEKGCIVGV